MGNPALVEKAIEESVKVWDDASNINFTEVHSYEADIVFRHSDRPNFYNAIAFGEYPYPGHKANIDFLTDFNWTTESLLYISTHEMGHALGLDHSEGVRAVMNGRYALFPDGLGSARLYQDDINGIQALYGKPPTILGVPLPINVNTIEHDYYANKHYRIEEFYRKFLFREADALGIDYWSQFSEENIIIGLLSSKERALIDPSVTGFYQILLNRTPTQYELSLWNGLDNQQILKIMVNSAEYRTIRVTEYYQIALQRMPGEYGLNSWVNSNLNLEQIAVGILTSQEFKSKY